MKFDRKESHKSGWDVMQDKVFSLYKDRGQEPLRKAWLFSAGIRQWMESIRHRVA